MIEQFNEESRRFSTCDSAISGLERALAGLGCDGFLYSVWKPSGDWQMLSDEAIITQRGPVRLKACGALPQDVGVDPGQRCAAVRNSAPA